MDTKKTLVVLGTAALCGFALAQTPKTSPALDRLGALEKEVEALRKELTDTRAHADQLVTWAAAQAESGAAMALMLADAEQKGFTFGINPESRVSLLEGWRSFAAGLQKDAPKPPPAKVAADKKSPERRNP